MNYEKVIPEVWWDFFGRLIPGMVILAELYFLGHIDIEFAKTMGALVALPIAFILGHLIQPFGSRTEEIVANFYRETIQKDVQDSLLKIEKSKSIPDTNDPNYHYDFRPIMHLPENFSEQYAASKKKHAEAVSFFSIFWPSYFLWIIAFPGYPQKEAALVLLPIILLLLLLGFKWLKNEMVWIIISILLIIPCLIWLRHYFCCGIFEKDAAILLLISLVAAFGGIERTTNKLKREMQTASEYHKGDPVEKLARRSTLITKSKE